MWEQITQTIAEMTGLSPLDVILLAGIGGGVIAVWRFMVKESRDSTTAMNNNTTAMNNLASLVEKNTEATNEMKDEVFRKLGKAKKP